MDESPRTARDDGREQTKPKGRKARTTVGSMDYVRPQYPHNIHPALVPGISVDEQRRRYGIDKVVFFVAGMLTLGFVIWGLTNPASVTSPSSKENSIR